MEKETKQKCMKCKGKFVPTDDFFIWKCQKCGQKFCIQMMPLEDEA